MTLIFDISGGFLSEAGWYENGEKILATSYNLCNIREQDGCRIATKFLTRYQRLPILSYEHLFYQVKQQLVNFSDDNGKVWTIWKESVKGFFSLEFFPVLQAWL